MEKQPELEVPTHRPVSPVGMDCPCFACTRCVFISPRAVCPWLEKFELVSPKPDGGKKWMTAVSLVSMIICCLIGLKTLNDGAQSIQRDIRRPVLKQKSIVFTWYEIPPRPICPLILYDKLIRKPPWVVSLHKKLSNAVVFDGSNSIPNRTCLYARKHYYHGLRKTGF